MAVFYAVLLKGIKSMGIQYWISAFPLMHRHFSRFLKSSDNTYVDDEIKVFATLCLEILFWKYSTTLDSFFHRLLNLCQFLLPRISASYSIPSHVTDLLPVHCISCKMFLELLLFSTSYFSSLLLPFFGDLSLPLNVKMSSYFSRKMPQLKHLLCFCVLL